MSRGRLLRPNPAPAAWQLSVRGSPLFPGAQTSPLPPPAVSSLTPGFPNPQANSATPSRGIQNLTGTSPPALLLHVDPGGCAYLALGSSPSGDVSSSTQSLSTLYTVARATLLKGEWGHITVLLNPSVAPPCGSEQRTKTGQRLCPSPLRGSPLWPCCPRAPPRQ